jgi:hypothetical protein
MQGFFGKTAGAGDGNTTTDDTTTNTTTDTTTNTTDDGSGEEAETHDYAAEMEAMLAPLRAQLEALTNKDKGGKIEGSADSGITGKPSYVYQPGNSNNSFDGAVDGKANLFDNWMNNQESLNRASTAYMFAPGGTRREDEEKASDTSQNDGDEGMKYWNQTDSDLVQTALADSQYDPEEAKRRATYFTNGDRAAGSVFDAWG